MPNRNSSYPTSRFAPDAAGATEAFLTAANTASTNPLHALCHIAARNLIVVGEELPVCGDGPALAPWAGTFATEAFPAAPDGEPLYDSVEFAGEAALYRHLNAAPDLEILFTGALGWQVRGIDAIARRKSDGVYLLCEAKGSGNPLLAPPAYLPNTKTKGRQFGWQWCWNSLIDMAEHPATAAAFLLLLPPLLEGPGGTPAGSHPRHPAIRRLALYGNPDLPGSTIERLCLLALPYPLDRQRAMFAEMVADSDGAALLNAVAVFCQCEEGKKVVGGEKFLPQSKRKVCKRK